MREVEVYLIRHGESTSNVELKILLESLLGLISFKSYSVKNIRRWLLALWRLTFSYELNSHLSDLGRRQAMDGAQYLQSELETKNGKVQIVHSCLIRAIETAQLMTKSDKPYLSLHDLNEANQMEHVMSSLLNKRIQSFQNWLITKSKEQNGITFVIFGHAQYFKYLLKKSEEMRNCDVWRVIARIHDDEQTISWSDLSLRHRSSLSYLHPIQVVKRALFGKSNSDMSAVEPQTAEGDRTCRICQMTSSESKERMIRPCLCRGTISYVHITCLNQWRSTSSQASYQCSVCHYRYLIQRTALSSFCTSDLGVNLMTCFLLFVILLIGGVLCSIIFHLTHFDLPLYFSSNYLNWHECWWRKCSQIDPPPDLLSSIFSNSSLWSYHHSFISQYVTLSLLNQLMITFCCNNFVYFIIEHIFSGFILVGLISLILCLLNQVVSLTHLFYIHFQEFQRHQQNILTFIAWLFSMNNVSLSKFGILYGIIIVGRAVYLYVQIYGRKFAQSIGENILEPTSDN